METTNIKSKKEDGIHWLQSIPFFIMHIMPLGAIWTEIHWLRDLSLCIFLYYARMFFLTGAYHRYFSHKSYKMGRFMQFLMAFGGTLAAQKGPLWWVAHHRYHHKYSDTSQDIHSPKDGFWWSHIGWILNKRYEKTRYDLIPDLVNYSELRWLNKHYLVPPTLLALLVFFLFGASGLFIGFFLSTALLYHGTFTINSLTHMVGKRRYATTDSSRNSFILALITCGEGWHNNHHHYQATAKAGFYWWEIDVTYYLLKLLERIGLVHDLKKPHPKVLEKRRLRDGHADIGMFQLYLEKAMVSLSTVYQQKGKIINEEKRLAIEALLKSTLEKAEEIIKEPLRPALDILPSRY